MSEFVNTAEAREDSTKLLGLVLNDLRSQYSEYVVDDGQNGQQLTLAGQAFLYRSGVPVIDESYRAIARFSSDAELPSLSLRTVVWGGYYRDDFIPDDTTRVYEIKSSFGQLEDDKELTNETLASPRLYTQAMVDIIQILSQLKPEAPIKEGPAVQEAKRRWGWLGKLGRRES